MLETATAAVKDAVSSVASLVTDDKPQAAPEGGMHAYVAESPEPPKEGDIIEGTVSAIGRARVYIELAPFGTGLIFGREYMNARDRKSVV